MNPIPNRFESPEPVHILDRNRDPNPNPNRMDEHDLITNIPLPLFMDKGHEDWLYRRGKYARSSTLFADAILPPTSEPWMMRLYRVLCCGSRKGVAGWIGGIFVVMIIVIVSGVEMSRSHVNTILNSNVNATAANDTRSLSTITTKATSMPPPIIGSSALTTALTIASVLSFNMTHSSSKTSFITRMTITISFAPTVIVLTRLTPTGSLSSALNQSSTVSVSASVTTSNSSMILHTVIVPP